MPSNALVLAVFGLVSLVAGQSASASASASPALVTHVITVANNQSATNGTNVFTPQVVNASLGDTVFFNFTAGNHSATQSTFANPCIPAHDTNSSINGFDTSIRPAGNGTSVTQFTLIMNPDIVNDTIWFYDQTTCGIGGVGVINPGNVSASLQTIDGFVRNAERLNGTGATSSSAAAPSATGADSGTSSGSGQNGTQTGSNTGNTGVAVSLSVVPAAVAALMVLGAALVV
jgi:plastocyanin